MKKYLAFVMVVAFAFSFASVALAQTNVPSSGIIPGGITANNLGTGGSVTDTTSLVQKIMDLVAWIAWFVGLMAVLMGLYAGILFITAAGNAESITKARSILLYAIVGIAVAVLAFSLVAISKSVFNL